ncbi:hypothetical protein HGB07_09655 [Candidatus Roizmanbacteria bacterium]|nr:hypothetical protein [Candidatus Roizmanbacteria bacterium]
MGAQETKIQKEVMQTLRDVPYVFAVRYSGYRPSFHKLWKTGGQDVGVADIICCVAGCYCELEIKTDTGVQSPEQIAHADKIVKMGGQYQVIKSAHDAYVFVSKVRDLMLYKLNKK